MVCVWVRAEQSNHRVLEKELKCLGTVQSPNSYAVWKSRVGRTPHEISSHTLRLAWDPQGFGGQERQAVQVCELGIQTGPNQPCRLGRSRQKLDRKKKKKKKQGACGDESAWDTCMGQPGLGLDLGPGTGACRMESQEAWIWMELSAIPAFMELRQEDHLQFKVNLNTQ